MSTELITRIAAARERVIAAEAGDALTPRPPARLPAETVSRMIDHTLLRPDAMAGEVRVLCAEAREHGFATVCVNPSWTALCAEELAGSPVGVCTVAGFPLGATLPSAKAHEAGRVVAIGATEVDMVLNVGALRSGDPGAVWEDVAGVVDVCHAGGARVKVIIEACLLSRDEKVAACVICETAGADYVKTSTGFAAGGATAEDVALMRFVVGPDVGVKAAGGIRTGADALAMIAAGADRLGASSGVRIAEDLKG